MLGLIKKIEEMSSVSRISSIKPIQAYFQIDGLHQKIEEMSSVSRISSIKPIQAYFQIDGLHLHAVVSEVNHDIEHY